MYDKYQQIKSALFVDFDNIYGSLNNKNPRVANFFAENPSVWLKILEQSTNNHDERSRYFLMRRCYINPRAFGRYRHNFTRAAFEVIDCPPLTARAKNAADILCVMDILDALKDYPHIEEFYILSSDSDFFPLVLRLRKHLKKSIIYTNEISAIAYHEACDSTVDEDDLISALAEEMIKLGISTGFEESEGHAFSKSAPQMRARISEFKSPKPLFKNDLSSDSFTRNISDDEEKLIETAAEQLIEAVKTAPMPYPLAKAAQLVESIMGKGFSENWGGYETFRRFISALNLPSISFNELRGGVLEYTPSVLEYSPQDIDNTGNFYADSQGRQPSQPPQAVSYGFSEEGAAPHAERQILPLPYVFDHSRASEALKNFIVPICEIIRCPMLTPEQYEAIFTHLAREVQENRFSIEYTKGNLEQRLREADCNVPPWALLYVMRGLSQIRHYYTPLDTAQKLAEKFRAQITALLAQAGRNLDAAESQLLKEWINGGA